MDIEENRRLPNIQPVLDDTEVKGSLEMLSLYEPEPHKLEAEEPNKPMEEAHIVIKPRKGATERQKLALAKAREARKIKKLVASQTPSALGSGAVPHHSKIADLENMVRRLEAMVIKQRSEVLDIPEPKSRPAPVKGFNVSSGKATGTTIRSHISF